MEKIDKVLLIEDDPSSVYLSKYQIEEAGLTEEIIVKENGREALAYLEKEIIHKGESSDKFLILLDLQMPDMNGFEFLKEFEKKYFKYNIPIVILTYATSAEDIIQLRGIGNYYTLSKPLTEESILNIQHRYFRNKICC